MQQLLTTVTRTPKRTAAQRNGDACATPHTFPVPFFS